MNATSWKPVVLDALGKLLAGRIMVVQKAPYWSNGVLRLIPEAAPGLGTIGVTARLRLLYDPEAVDGWAKEPRGNEKMGGAMAHETLHILLDTHGRCLLHGWVSDEQRKRGNIASDLANNCILRAMGFVLPDGALYPEQFKFPADLSMEAYYALLQEREAKQAKQGAGTPKQGPGKPEQGAPKGGKGEAPGEGAGTPGGGSSDPGDKPGVGAGWCGSCAGRPVPGEPSDDAAPQPGDATDADIENIRRGAAAAMREASAKAPGTIPGELLRWADEMLQPPRVRWQQKLTRATRRGVGVRNGVQDYTWTRPSRRQGGIGSGVGKVILPAMYAQHPRVAFALDTSGSMGAAELSLAGSEVQGVLRSLGYPVEFLSCDSKLHTVKRVKRVQDLADAVQGGGGTDFRPVFDRLHRDGFTGVLIFATDGFGPAPVEPPAGVYVIWLLVGERTQRPAPWGEVVELTEDA